MSEWISVDERLPEPMSKTVDLLTEDGRRLMRCFLGRDGHWWQMSFGTELNDVIKFSPITHWMPVPKSPKAKKRRDRYIPKVITDSNWWKIDL